MTPRTPDYLTGLVRELRRLPAETEWVEFKVNVAQPEEIGEYLSALSNAAAFCERPHAYLVWGIANDDHSVVGTEFAPGNTRIGNEQLENWLLHLLTPRIHFQFSEVVIDDKRVIVLEIEPAFRHPVRFRSDEFIRVGSYKKKLKEHPEREKALWQTLSRTVFEDGVALDRVKSDDVIRLLDYPAYFELLKLPLPDNRDGILNRLADDRLVSLSPAGGWNISNLGALLFAKRLDEFRTLSRKAVRVIQYRGTDRVSTIREQVGNRGYASGFEGLIGFINGLLPSNEVVEQALRKSVPLFPELAVRELVANAIVHQDLAVTGAGPMVEIFDDRLEITNPGAPLMDTQRFVDTPPRSRNEVMASLMRRIGVCEERGSGWDKVVFETEYHQLPAPLAEVPGDNTRVVAVCPEGPGRDGQDRTNQGGLPACLPAICRARLPY